MVAPEPGLFQGRGTCSQREARSPSGQVRITCDDKLVDTPDEAAALGDVVIHLRMTDVNTGAAIGDDFENTVTGPANSGDLFRFDDTGDLFIIAVKGLKVGGHSIEISGGGDTQSEFFRIIP